MLRIKEIRKAQGMTARVLAQKVGLTESAINLYENGKRKPDYEMVLKLADALGCLVEELIGSPQPSEDGSYGDRILFQALAGATEQDKIRAAKIINMFKESSGE